MFKTFNLDSVHEILYNNHSKESCPLIRFNFPHSLVSGPRKLLSLVSGPRELFSLMSGPCRPLSLSCLVYARSFLSCLVHTSSSLSCLVHASSSLSCLVHAGPSLSCLVYAGSALSCLVHADSFPKQQLLIEPILSCALLFVFLHSSEAVSEWDASLSLSYPQH